MSSALLFCVKLLMTLKHAARKSSRVVKDMSPAMMLQERVSGRLAPALAARRARGPRDPVFEGPAVACVGVTLPHPRRSP